MMQMRSKSQQSRTRKPTTPSKKVQLTKYYRSGPGEGTGTTSPFVASPRRSKPFRRWLVRGVDVVIVAALFFGLIFSMLVKAEPQVKINSLVYHPINTYSQFAAKQLGALKNRNKLTLNEAGLASILQHQFPEITAVYLELPLFSQKPIIHLSVAAPTFLLSSESKLYLIDAEGRAVSGNVNSAGFKSLPIIADQSGFAVAQAKQVLSSKNVSFINGLLAQCKHAGVPIASLTLPPKAQDLDLRTSDKDYYTKFFLGGDVYRQTGQFLAARHQFVASGTGPAEYLDVRVLGKIYYR